MAHPEDEAEYHRNVTEEARAALKDRATICPFCGASGPDRCELDEETGGECPWLESGEYDEAQEPSHD